MNNLKIYPSIKDGLYGVIDKTGKWIIEPQFDYIKICNDVVIVEQNNLLGIKNLNGEWIVKPYFDWIYPFVKNLAVVEKGGYAGIIDKEGKMFLNLEFDNLKIYNNLIKAEKNGYWGIMNFNKEWIIKPQYTIIKIYDNFAIAQQKNKKNFIKLFLK